MRLTEFYSMDMSDGRFYTLEPETNGMGRLLAWDRDTYSDIDDLSESADMSYEVVAKGNIDDLLDALRDAEPLSPDDEDTIRDLFDQAVESGEAVQYSERDGATMTRKSGEEEEDYSDEDAL